MKKRFIFFFALSATFTLLSFSSASARSLFGDTNADDQLNQYDAQNIFLDMAGGCVSGLNGNTDLNSDSVVDVTDLQLFAQELIGTRGFNHGSLGRLLEGCLTMEAGDTNEDGIIDDFDLVNVLFDFGFPPSGSNGHTDFTGGNGVPDGIVDDFDLATVIFNWEITGDTELSRQAPLQAVIS